MPRPPAFIIMLLPGHSHYTRAFRHSTGFIPSKLLLLQHQSHRDHEARPGQGPVISTCCRMPLLRAPGALPPMTHHSSHLQTRGGRATATQ